MPVTSAALAVAASLLITDQYSAVARFVPEQGPDRASGLGPLASIAAQFALAGSGSNSPRFYGEVLRGHTILDEVLLSRFPTPGAPQVGDSSALWELLRIEGDSIQEILASGRKELEKRIGVSVDDATGVTAVSVQTSDASLSAGVANALVSLLNRFNLETRQTTAKLRRAFVEARLDELSGELHDSERALRDFLLANRGFETSPDLRLQHDRLERDFTLKQEVFTTLQRQFEEARIQEVNDTPVITIVDYAVAPFESSYPPRLLVAAIGFALGSLVALLSSIVGDVVASKRRDGDQRYTAFLDAWTSIRSQIRQLIRVRPH